MEKLANFDERKIKRTRNAILSCVSAKQLTNILKNYENVSFQLVQRSNRIIQVLLLVS